MSRKYILLCIWVFCSLVAAAIALQLTHSTYFEGVWHPVSNDSFYHARRILDAVDSERGFYQFDEMIHAPEGSWLTWPWAYDWLMAKFVQIWQLFQPGMDSMEILTHIAVYWIFVNALLLLGITVVLELPIAFSAMVLLGFALSPLTQGLHGVGIIDHHYIEYSFVLTTLFTGLYWLKKPEVVSRGVWLGLALGIAPAFHTGLFILQVPLLVTVFVLWLRRYAATQRGYDGPLLCSATGHAGCPGSVGAIHAGPVPVFGAVLVSPLYRRNDNLVSCLHDPLCVQHQEPRRAGCAGSRSSGAGLGMTPLAAAAL